MSITFLSKMEVIPFVFLAGRLTACEEYSYRNCQDGSAIECNLAGVYSPRQWKETLQEAKNYCDQNSSCRGITRDDNGYEPRRGLDVNNHDSAHELWLCKGEYL